jgi:hypothetical protein
MLNRRDAQLRHAKIYCERAQQYKASGRLKDIRSDYANILLGLETSEKYEDYELLTSYVRALSDIWKGSEWQQYKHWIPLVLGLVNIDMTEKSGYLTQLAMIEESEGNFETAKKLLEEKYFLLMGSKDQINKNDFSEIALHIAHLAQKVDKLEMVESILLEVLDIANSNGDLQQQVNILLELSLIPEIKNNYQKSIDLIDRGLDLALMIGYKVRIIDLLIAKASICGFHKHFAEAMSANKKALDLAMTINDRHRIVEIEKQQLTLRNFPERKVFISYNHADKQLAQKIAGDLQEEGLSVWWDEWEIKVGDSIIQKISNGITTSAHLIVLLSPHSTCSAWVQREINSVLMKQLSEEKGITILPVLLADCEIPILLRDIRWADFRKSYKSGLAELLKALK